MLNILLCAPTRPVTLINTGLGFFYILYLCSRLNSAFFYFVWKLLISVCLNFCLKDKTKLLANKQWHDIFSWPFLALVLEHLDKTGQTSKKKWMCQSKTSGNKKKNTRTQSHRFEIQCKRLKGVNSPLKVNTACIYASYFALCNSILTIE